MTKRIFSHSESFERLDLAETLMSLSNGYLGVRGSPSEIIPSNGIRGSYINGFYDRIPMVHAEMAVGFPTEVDKLVRIIDTQTIHIYLDGQQVIPTQQNTTDFRYELDLDEGFTVRSFNYKVGKKQAQIRFERLASLWDTSLFVYRVQIEYPGEIRLESIVETDVYNHVDSSDPRVGQHAEKLLLKDRLSVNEGAVDYAGHTKTTGAQLLAAIRHRSLGTITSQEVGDRAITTVTGRQELQLEKRVILTDSYHFSDPSEALLEKLEQIEATDYAMIRRHQTEIVQMFWDDSAIVLSSNDDAGQLTAYLQFQLFQNAPRGDSGNIAAKGLSGEGYEGHYFWDSEMYLLPVLEWTAPALAKPLLKYRYNILDQARKRSREMGHARGACYAWRSISGIECSGYFPAGSAQYHLNGDIAHAAMQHYLIHDDLDMLAHSGAEVLFETARLWLEVGHFHDDQFHIYHVTGPDEYSAIVDDNYYTNLVARENLLNAVKVYHILEQKAPTELARICQTINFSEAELTDFKRAAEAMVLPFDEDLGIHAQDASFLTRPIWDLAAKRHLQPLLLHVHPLTIYRHQVLKQADTVLAYTLVETDEDIMKRSFDYYEALTTHDSSLSKCIYGIMAARLGDLDKAYRYFLESLRLDVYDTQGNTRDGLHMANVAGALLSILTGFAGLRVKSDRLILRPKLPRQLDGYRFKIHYRDRLIKLSVADEYQLELLQGDPVDVEINGRNYTLANQLEGAVT